MKKDYSLIHYIQGRLSNFNDKKLTNAVVNAFNRLCVHEEPDGCLATSVELYIAMKYLGYEPKICYGLVELPDGYGFYHAWVGLNGSIIDVAIFANAHFSPLSHFEADKPVICEKYCDNPNGMIYKPFEFDEYWHFASISRAQGVPVAKYCDNSPRGVIWEFTCNLLDISPTRDNVVLLRKVVGSDVL